jgi:hypothetical protein
MMPDGAPRDRAEYAVMACEVPDRSTNQSALDAPFGLCWSARANDKQQQRACGKQSGHLILSKVMRVVGCSDNTAWLASFR